MWYIMYIERAAKSISAALSPTHRESRELLKKSTASLQDTDPPFSIFYGRKSYHSIQLRATTTTNNFPIQHNSTVN